MSHSTKSLGADHHLLLGPDMHPGELLGPDMRPSVHEWFGPSEAIPMTKHAGEPAAEPAGREPTDLLAASGGAAAHLFRGLF